MTYLNLEFRSTNGGTQIELENDGIEKLLQFDEQNKMIRAQFVFGTVVSSTHNSYGGEDDDDYDDDFGLGSKLTNSFSKQFEVEIFEGGQRYYQLFKNNMRDVSSPVIEEDV